MATSGLILWCAGCDRRIVVTVRVNQTFSTKACGCGVNDWRTNTTRRGRTFEEIITDDDRALLRSFRIKAGA